MNLGEARDRLAATVSELQEEGFSVAGWDNGSITVYQMANRLVYTWVDPNNLDDKPDATRGVPPYRGRI